MAWYAWVSLGILVWLAVAALVMAMCAVAGRADDAQEREVGRE